ncbi:MAG: thioredoxin domain-containing protein [Bacteroidales bacterium]|jgi:protein-disulfide isomerase|nr:thioredoxin domain-containing protein [Bacteroidales bacterium]
MVKKKKRTNLSKGSRYQEIKQARAKQKRIKTALISTAAALAVALVAVLIFINVNEESKDDPTSAKYSETLSQLQNVQNPKNTTSDGGIVMAKKDETASINSNIPTVEVFFDPICPACGSFEQTFGEELKKLFEDGKINYIIRPVAIMDVNSTTDYAVDKYSTRAASAVAYVANYENDKVLDFIAALLSAENQPPEVGYQAITEEFFYKIATEAECSSEVISSINNTMFTPWVDIVTQAFRFGEQYYSDNNGTKVISTPQVWVSGTRVDPSVVIEAIEEIQAQIDAQNGTASN